MKHPNSQTKLLVLDLDETLVHATDEPLELAHDFECGPYVVYKRPHLAEFLEEVSAEFELGVWTASSADYAACVVNNLFRESIPLSFVLSRRSCVRRFDAERYEYTHGKDLRKLKKKGYALEQIVVVDDSPEKLSRNYGNLVRVAPFYGEPSDKELYFLKEYLLHLKDVKNVREVEKRGWRGQTKHRLQLT